MPDDNDYEVGYAKPPRGTRFKKGRSGNPRGRPKGALNIDSVLDRALQEKIFVNENGRRRRITKKQGAVIQLVNRALAGEPKATQLLWQQMRHAEEKLPLASQPSDDSCSVNDSEIIETILKRFIPQSEGEE